MAKWQVGIIFSPCGAEFHPAFSRAVRSETNGCYWISFPIGKGLLESKKAQRRWAEDARKHLLSWSGSNPVIIEFQVGQELKYVIEHSWLFVAG